MDFDYFDDAELHGDPERAPTEQDACTPPERSWATRVFSNPEMSLNAGSSEG